MNGVWEVWTDTGGTFTDCVARDPEGRSHRVKVLSTSALRGTLMGTEGRRTLRVGESWGAPPDFPVGFRVRVQGPPGALGRASGYDPDRGLLHLDTDLPTGAEGWDEGAAIELLSPEPAPLLAARLVTRTPADRALPEGLRLRLATTRGTNALLERRGAPLALFVTRGFRDLLRIGDQQRPDLFALDVHRAEPLPGWVVEVDERIAADGSVLEKLDPEPLRRHARRLLEDGVGAAAVALTHAYRNPVHEERVAAVLREEGLSHVAASSETAPFIHLLRRAETTAVEGYLAPVIRSYVDRIRESLPGDRLLVMTSAGGLGRGESIRAKDTLLSGPAGGVVGAARAGLSAGAPRTIAFDMGGTSTDVSRFDGEHEYTEEHRVGDARLRSPALAIETVAAGGGSICGVDANGLTVGPASAGADPGPACYGAGGPLTLTDVNLLLGRLDPSRFGIPVTVEPAREQAESTLAELQRRTGEDASLEPLLEGFLDLANERMADAIRRISVRKGYDPAEYALVAFGGAGPQHACALADRLGMERVVVPADAGVLSAVGLGQAVVERFRHRQILRDLDEVAHDLPGWFDELAREARHEVAEEGVSAEHVEVRQRIAHLRYRGQEATLPVPIGPDTDPASAFETAYEAVYGHRAERRAIEVESLRVVASARGRSTEAARMPEPTDVAPHETVRGWFDGAWREVPVFGRSELPPGAHIEGPALVWDRHSAAVVERGWRCRLDEALTLVMERTPAGEATGHTEDTGARARPRAVEEELFVQRFRAVVGEMGAQLRKTALSVNIRERLDFSCALLDPRGRLVANAPHMPVHLGAMGVCVRSVASALPLGPGDVAITNHPRHGGSHLPDVTVVTPVFVGTEESGEPRLLGYVASRAHHAEIGGTRPGSMPPDARTLAEEGVVIPPFHLVRDGDARWPEVRRMLGEGPAPSRAVEENLVDLAAQVAANHRGARLLEELAEREGAERVLHHMDVLRDRAASRMRQVLRGLGDGAYTAIERLDDGTPLQVEIRIRGEEAAFDFTGTGPEHPGNLNAPEAVARSAVLYLLRLLAAEELPLNEGLMEPVRIHLPRGILAPAFEDDATLCPAVVGGNVETSQRLVDTLLKPFELVACSQGTMNNLLFGDDTFSYYETIGGGAGAGPGFHGASATQVHMTNTRITDVEVLEHRFPVRVLRFRIRDGSGGDGRWRGGDGMVRELLFLRDLSVSVVTQHRKEAPYGCRGGMPGATGGQHVVRSSGETLELGSVDGCEVSAGDRIVIETPGGGGYGAAGEDAS